MTLNKFLRESCYINSLTDCSRRIKRPESFEQRIPSSSRRNVLSSWGWAPSRKVWKLTKSLYRNICLPSTCVNNVRHRVTRKHLSETSVRFCRSTRRHFLEDGNFHSKHTFSSNTSKTIYKQYTAIINMKEKSIYFSISIK